MSTPNETPTPETDAEAYMLCDSEGFSAAGHEEKHPNGDHVSADFARRLEQQRDELKAILARHAPDAAKLEADLREANENVQANWNVILALRKQIAELEEDAAVAQSTIDSQHVLMTNAEQRGVAKGRKEMEADNARLRAALEWQPIETAPMDGTEVLGWREDCGVFLMRWICAADFLTEKELEGWSEESAVSCDWFYADFCHGGRLEGSEAPTHWQPLPAPRA